MSSGQINNVQETTGAAQAGAERLSEPKNGDGAVCTPGAARAVRAPIRTAIAKREHVRWIVEQKRKWHHQPSDDEKAEGFKGWYSRGYLPHFDAKGVQQFITYRLFDSIPAKLRREWEEIQKLKDPREKFRQIESRLDRGNGKCYLRNSAVAQLIQDNFWFHDGRSYRLLAWVLMPNHVHVLVETWEPLAKILKKWKSYTASEAIKLLGRVQPFWKADYFDRYIRDLEQYRRVVRYIENNPVKAGLVLAPAEWPWSSARYRGRFGSDELPFIPQTVDADNNSSNLQRYPDPRAEKAVRAPSS